MSNATDYPLPLSKPQASAQPPLRPHLDQFNATIPSVHVALCESTASPARTARTLVEYYIRSKEASHYAWRHTMAPSQMTQIRLGARLQIQSTITSAGSPAPLLSMKRYEHVLRDINELRSASPNEPRLVGLKLRTETSDLPTSLSK